MGLFNRVCFFFHKTNKIKTYFKNKTILITNCYHPIAREIIYYLNNLLKKEIRLILIGKHPAFVSYIGKKIIDKNDYNIERSKYLLSFSIDTRNYSHVKKAFKVISKEWGKIDFIFHFDDYYIEKPIKELPIHNFKYLQQWNQLSFLNVIKAHLNYIDSFVSVLTIQNSNKKSLYYFLRKSFINYLNNNNIKVFNLYLPEEIIQYSSQKPRKKFLQTKIITNKQIEKILIKFIKKKSYIILK